MIAWLLNGIYVALLTVLSPILLYRMIVQGKYRQGWSEKFRGRLTRQHPDKPCLWFHAVSVGEVLQLQRLLARLREELPDHEFLITTTTHTGHQVARNKFPRDQVCFCPLDFSLAVKNAFRRIRPQALVLVELELWPNLIHHAHRLQIPVFLVNARISENSFRGYRKIRPVIRRTLRQITHIGVQQDDYAQRLLELGARLDQVTVTGSLKYDQLLTDRQNTHTRELAGCFQVAEGESVLIAGSTQAPEESLALDCYEQLKPAFPQLRLLLVPRHQERFEEVAELVRGRQLPLLRRSKLRDGEAKGLTRSANASGAVDVGGGQTNSAPASAVCLLDTLGELSACWGLAEIAFVGGSLTNRGGQNMMEPAAFGAAVLFGPNTWNFQETVDLLLNVDAATVVHDGPELTNVVRSLLERPELTRRQGEAARNVVTAKQGAVNRTVELLLAHLDRLDGRMTSRAA